MKKDMEHKLWKEKFSNILDYLDESITIIQDYNKIEKVVDTINEQAKYYDDNNIYKFLPKEIDNKIYVDLINNYDKYNYTFIAEEIQNYNDNNLFGNNDYEYQKQKNENIMIM